jgi:pseudaminic acid synthase
MKPPFIVAEMSANHLGSLRRALDIVDAAAEAGADAIKVQTWTPGTMCIDREFTLDHGPWAGRRLADLYQDAYLPWDYHRPIFDRARARGLVPFGAAFDRGAVDFLETLDVDRHKVASFELTDLPLIRYMASKGKPMILSTGMATLKEIAAAMIAAETTPGCQVGPTGWMDLTLLKCTSAYPAALERANLATLADLRGNSRIGLSDHTLGHEVAMLATALGATMIEKHLTLSRADGGPDAGFSMEPHEFKAMVQACKRAAAIVGEVQYGPQPGEDTSLRRSLWVARDIDQGEPLRLGDNVVTARPALGLPPSTELTGRRASRALKASTPLTQEDLA